MEFLKSLKYDSQFIKENMMGPNALKMIEELTLNLDLHPGMRVLDLGCGKGLTSIFLAKEFGAEVYATDLWIGATENFERFKNFGLEKSIIPIHANANHLPFANGYFDAVISVDAYYYFGREDDFMDKKLAPFIKPNGLIAMAFPGFKEEIHHNLPKELLISWKPEDLETFHSCQWWQQLLSKSKQITLESIEEMKCFEECWNDWLDTENTYAINDRLSMEAGGEKYMNIISVIAKKRG